MASKVFKRNKSSSEKITKRSRAALHKTANDKNISDAPPSEVSKKLMEMGFSKSNVEMAYSAVNDIARQTGIRHENLIEAMVVWLIEHGNTEPLEKLSSDCTILL